MNKQFLPSRRNFLGSALALGVAAGLPANALAAAPPRRFLGPEEFKTHLRGPIVSLPTPFDSNFNVDYDGFRRMIRLGLDHGMEIFELTAGNSHFGFLSYDEIKEVTRIVVEAVGDKGLTIAATAPWWTQRVVDFARYAESLGATALQVPVPDGDEAGRVKHYQAVARSTRLPLVLQGNYPDPLLDELVKIDSIVALKEDVTLNYVIDSTGRFNKRLNCFAGGSYDWFLAGQPYGAIAYFDTYATFAPSVSVRFWKAVQANDMQQEVEINLKYDRPFLTNFTFSWWHATLEYFGVAKRYLRPPQHSYTDSEMKSVKAFFDERGLYPLVSS